VGGMKGDARRGVRAGFATAALLAAPLAWAAPAPAQAPPAPCLVTNVLGSLARGDFAKALAEAEPCKGSAAYARLKGQAFHGLYDADSAIHYLRIDLARGKDDAVLVALAEALVWKKETREAGRLLDKVRDRKTPSYFKAMASLHEARGKFAKAVEMYDQAIAAEKDPAATELRKAMALSWQRKFEASIALYTALLEREAAPPGFKTRCRVLRAQVIAWKGDLDRAAAELLEVLGREPKHFEARLQLGEIREWQGRFKEAKDQYRDVLLSDPENAAAKRRLAGLLWVK
jgi:tetratricopeptide (TPR) repeat protein